VQSVIRCYIAAWIMFILIIRVSRFVHQGAQKLSLPTLLSANSWRQTGRWETAGSEVIELYCNQVGGKGRNFFILALITIRQHKHVALPSQRSQAIRVLPCSNPRRRDHAFGSGRSIFLQTASPQAISDW